MKGCQEEPTPVKKVYLSQNPSRRSGQESCCQHSLAVVPCVAAAVPASAAALLAAS